MFTSITDTALGNAQETSLAAQFVARLWSITLPVYGQQSPTQGFVHARQVFDQQFLERLALPIGKQRPSTQSIALVNGTDFQREVDEYAASAAYNAQRRTRVYEGINIRSDGWYSLAALQLARLTRCRVGCSLYESDAGDASIVPHVDAWFGAIVQMRGSKAWTLRRPEAEQPEELITNAGDVLLMPPTVLHAVATPNYSAHLVFAIIANEPIAKAMA